MGEIAEAVEAAFAAGRFEEDGSAPFAVRAELVRRIAEMERRMAARIDDFNRGLAIGRAESMPITSLLDLVKPKAGN